MKLFLLNFVALALTHTVFVQEEYPTDYKIQYELTFKIDSLNMERIDTEKMFLFAGSNYGVFMNEIRSDADERLEKLKQKLGEELATYVQFKIGVNSNKGQDFYKSSNRSSKSTSKYK